MAEQVGAPLAATHNPAFDGVRGLAILFVLAYRRLRRTTRR
jgi:peptidoglycan/LPS O-acetylase OafA/YrhL